MKQYSIVLIALLVVLGAISIHPQIAFSATPSGYRNATTLINDTLSWESQYPSLISHSQIGTTVNGKPIYVFKIGNPDGGKVLIDAGMHGYENVGSELVWWFMNWLLTSSDQDAANIRQRNCVMVVPIVNIDSFQGSRYNAHGVDLNRNFQTGWGAFDDAARGSAPLSEPETQALFNFVSAQHPKWYLNLYSGDVRVSPPYGYLSSSQAPEPAYFQAVYNNYSRICSNPIPYVRTFLYGGGLARDQMYALGAYSYTVEVVASNPAYSEVSTTMLNRFKPLVVTIAQEAAIVNIEHTLTLGVSGTGSISPSVGSHTYVSGTVVPITITSGTLQGWYLDGVPQGTSTLSVTMDSDHSVSVQFSTVSPDYRYIIVAVILITAFMALLAGKKKLLQRARRWF